MKEKIKEYRKDVRKSKYCVESIYSVVIVLCVITLTFLISALVGWCETFKVDGALANALLVSFFIILIIVTAWLFYLLLSSIKRYRVALARLDILVLKLDILNAKSQSLGWVERELQHITRILES